MLALLYALACTSPDPVAPVEPPVARRAQHPEPFPKLLKKVKQTGSPAAVAVRRLGGEADSALSKAEGLEAMVDVLGKAGWSTTRLLDPSTRGVAKAVDCGCAVLLDGEKRVTAVLGHHTRAKERWNLYQRRWNDIRTESRLPAHPSAVAVCPAQVGPECPQ